MDLKLGLTSAVLGASGRRLGSKRGWLAEREGWPGDRVEISWPGAGPGVLCFDPSAGCQELAAAADPYFKGWVDAG